MENTTTGFHHRFEGGNLDPRAQEFVPRNYYHNNLPFVSNNFYYPSTPYLHQQPQAPQPLFPPPPATASYVITDYHHSVSQPPTSHRTMSSRALLLTMVPTDVSESTIRRELEIFGDVRSVQMERVREGIVTVHFYNLRQAQEALTAIQSQHMQQQYRLRRHYESISNVVVSPPQNSFHFSNFNSLPPPPPPPIPPPSPGLVSGRAIWAQFTAPVPSSLPDGNNQGTLVLFNLDPDVTTFTLKQTFEAFGAVKELRETPMKKHQRFVEFYDVRDAAKALSEMNGKEIHGKQIVIEFSRPGGGFTKKKLHSKFPSTSTTSVNFIRPIFPPPPPSPPQQPPPPPPSSCNVIVRPKSGGGGPKRNCKKTGGSSGGGTGCSKEGRSSSRAWKGLRQQSKEYDPRYLIKEDAIMESTTNCRDSRTTVMIKNIPNKYSQKLLLNMLDNHCIHCNEQIANGGGEQQQQQPFSSYDFVYLPIDFVNKCNVGYGFVNMTSPEATLRLYKAFHRQSWEVFNSRKICEVTYARLQGVEALKEHFKNSKFPCEADEYMPVIFSPPRDGRRQLTDPVPIICSSSSYRSSCTSSSAALSSKEDESSNGNNDYNNDYGDFREDDGGGKDDGDDDVDGGGSSGGGGESGGDYQYYDGDDVDDGSQN